MIEAVGVEAAEMLADLHECAFEKPWSATEIARLIENPAVFTLVSRSEVAQGFAMAWAAAGDAELLTLAVIPVARRKGVGASLLNSMEVTALVRGAATLHLEVAEDNLAARSLYAKLGYEEAGRRHAYYAGRGGYVDAIIMRRTLARPLV